MLSLPSSLSSAAVQASSRSAISQRVWPVSRCLRPSRSRGSSLSLCRRVTGIFRARPSIWSTSFSRACSPVLISRRFDSLEQQGVSSGRFHQRRDIPHGAGRSGRFIVSRVVSGGGIRLRGAAFCRESLDPHARARRGLNPLDSVEPKLL